MPLTRNRDALAKVLNQGLFKGMLPEDEMRKISIAVGVALTLSCPGAASYAQTPVLQEPVATSHKINLTLEQRHVIKEIVKDMKTESARAEFTPALGDPVPATVKLQPIPAEIAQKVPQVKTHVFCITDEQVVIVDPKDNKVAEIIKLAGD
jgi:hypothetical protein